MAIEGNQSQLCQPPFNEAQEICCPLTRHIRKITLS